MAASTERTIPSVHSFTLPNTLPAVLLANPGVCVTVRSGEVTSGRVPVGTGTPPHPRSGGLDFDHPRHRGSVRARGDSGRFRQA